MEISAAPFRPPPNPASQHASTQQPQQSMAVRSRHAMHTMRRAMHASAQSRRATTTMKVEMPFQVRIEYLSKNDVANRGLKRREHENRAKNKPHLHSTLFQIMFKHNDLSAVCTTYNGNPVLFVSDHHALKARLVRPQTTTQK